MPFIGGEAGLAALLAAADTIHPLPELTHELDEQPVEWVDEVAGLYFRSVLLKRKGSVIPQHEHDHDHATYCGAGSARLWVDRHWRQDLQAGQAVAIEAGHSHVFQSLEDNTRLTCVHDVASAESIKRKGV